MEIGDPEVWMTPEKSRNQGIKKPIASHFAVREGSLNKVELLLDKGAQVNAKDMNVRTTSLHDAVGIDVVKLLLERGSDVNAKDYFERTPLHDAAEEGSLDAVRLLLERGARVNDKDQFKRTALHYAANDGLSDVVRLLLEHGADVNAKDEHGRTPLYNFLKSRPHGSVSRDILKLLIVQYGADLKSRDNRGQTPAHLISSELPSEMNELNIQSILDLVTVFFSHGADFINAVDPFGITPYNSIIRSHFHSVSLKIIAVTHIRILVALAAAHLPEKNRPLFLKIAHLSSNNWTKVMPESQVELDIANKEDGRDYYKKCRLEIQKMEDIKVLGDIKLVDILTLGNPVTMAKISRNIDYQEYVNSENLNSLFPIYSFLIRLQYRKSLEMNNLCEKTEISLLKIFPRKINTYCAYMLLQHLSEIDLKNLNEATKNVDSTD